MRQKVHLRDIGFAVEAKLLPLKNPASGQRAHAHAIADEQDDIARLIVIGLVGEQALQLGLASLEIAFAGADRRLGGRRCGSRRGSRSSGRRALRQQRRGDQAGCQKGG